MVWENILLGASNFGVFSLPRTMLGLILGVTIPRCLAIDSQIMRQRQKWGRGERDRKSVAATHP